MVNMIQKHCTLDPCAGGTCSGDGITPYANLGICQCLCGGKAYDHTANRCVSGVLKCGANAACSGVHGYCYKHDAKTTADSNAYTTSAITTSDTTGGMACVVGSILYYIYRLHIIYYFQW